MTKQANCGPAADEEPIALAWLVLCPPGDEREYLIFKTEEEAEAQSEWFISRQFDLYPAYPARMIEYFAPNPLFLMEEE